MAAPLIANRYLVRRQLGVGGQGEVYEVLDTHEGDVVALKLLTSIGGGGPWVEAQILRRLADPHILPIRNADVASGRPYLVTELATYGALDSALAGTSVGLPVDDVVRLMRQASHGVARAHDLRLLHNDLKPGNLFLNAEGECLVGDFGFASLVPPGATTVAPPGATPETTAPEVAAGVPIPGAATASVRSDVYSLGATAYWLLTGRPPVDVSSATNFLDKMALVATETPPRLRDLAPHVPGYVAGAIERAIDLHPAARFASATEFAAALGRRPTVARRWTRTDEHPGHIACFRGEPHAGGSTYVTCVEQGTRATQAVVVTRHLSSGRRVAAGCKDVPLRQWPRAVRSVIRSLG